jgi:Zn-dependent metalloprotease
VAPEVFLAEYAPSLWDLSKHDELRLMSTLRGFNGYVEQEYGQFHAGYRVKSGRVALSVSAGGVVVHGVGKPIGGLAGIPTEVRITEASALEQARRRTASACFLNGPLAFATTIPPRLMISDRDRRPIWLTTVVATEPMWVEWAVEIDAATGQLLREWGGVGVNGWLGGCSPIK